MQEENSDRLRSPISNAVLNALERKVKHMSYYNRNFENDEMACLLAKRILIVI